MGFRCQRRVSLGDGARLNLRKRGMSRAGDVQQSRREIDPHPAGFVVSFQPSPLIDDRTGVLHLCLSAGMLGVVQDPAVSSVRGCGSVSTACSSSR